LLDDAIDVERQLGLQQLLISVWQSEIGEHVASP
jgi:hypothetical protein